MHSCSSLPPCRLLPAQLQIVESWQGKWLLRRGVAHVGAWITQLHRLRLAVPGDKLNRQGLLACSAQGSLLLLCPLWDEGLFRRLQSLQVGTETHDYRMW
jgi:hypothetical protein